MTKKMKKNDKKNQKKLIFSEQNVYTTFDLDHTLSDHQNHFKDLMSIMKYFSFYV